MKTKTVTVYEGELLGPIDWGFDFRKHYEGYYNCGTKEQHEEMLRRALAMLKLLERDPEKYEATTYGGWPRCGWGAILSVGMYDGWPWWKPIPSICIASSLGGGEWASFANMTDIRVRGECWPLKV